MAEEVNSTPLWLPLTSPAATRELVGGKGASLRRLAAAGFPVPPGFDLTTEAYRRFVAQNDLAPVIAAALANMVGDDPAMLERIAGNIQSRFAQATIPEPVLAALDEGYASLGGAPAVAVRSSATAEDLPDLSFAGQQESVLDVRGEAALAEAVRRCWASLWSARAIGYRQRMGIDQRALAMGIVVQELVPAEVSGVIFTANPTTGARDELVINASYGLGEAIVSGEVSPDTFVLDHSTLQVRAKTLGEKTFAIQQLAGQGPRRYEVPSAERSEFALSDQLLRQLGEVALRVEALAGGVPQDIEWAVADGRLWLLQARPITNLPAPPLADVRWEPPVPNTAWIRRQVVEHMPGPVSPLFAELYLQQGLEPGADAIVAALGVSEELMQLVERPLLATINGYAYMRATYAFRWSLVPALLRASVSIFSTIFRSGIGLWRDVRLPAYLLTIERWRSIDLAAATDEQLLAGVRELARADASYWWSATMAIGAAKVSDSVFDRFLSLVAPGRGLTSAMYLRGFPAKTLEAEADLERVAGLIRENEELRALVAATPAGSLLDALADTPHGETALLGLHRYFERFGHQIYTLDFAEPTLLEDPLPVLLSLKAMVAQPGRAAAARHDATVRERERLVAETERSLDPMRRFLFRRLLQWAEQFAPFRDEALFYVGAAWPTLRRFAHELGRRLADAGSLDAADDIFFLTSAEIEEANAAPGAGRARDELAKLARERRARREARKRLHPPGTVPPDYRYRFGPFDLAGFETQRRNVLAAGTLQGFPVSPGRVTAPASVIRSPADFETMEPGTILVCPTTTPAWTLLFAQARGLVTDIGGVLAHGSIVAREYGIPAVMGTGDATQRIANGQVVTVDGTLGTVTLAG
jgi:pyruvate,water dikinase